jgi:proteasome lid subunit RPN8/RPN11
MLYKAQIVRENPGILQRERLLQRIRKIANAHPEIEVGANLYYYLGRYHLGEIQKGKRHWVAVQENDRIIGQFHSHPNGTEPSTGDWKTLCATIEIVVTPQCIYVGEFRRVPKDYKDYICAFDVVHI